MVGDQRQGDIYFQRVKSIDPAWVHPAVTNVIAEGEATGHKHSLLDGMLFSQDPMKVERDYALGESKNGNTLGYIVATDETQVKHDEHGLLKLGRGIYKVFQQREFTGKDNQLERYEDRRVID